MTRIIVAGLVSVGLFWGGQAPDILDLTQSRPTAIESSDPQGQHPGRGSATGIGDHSLVERLNLELKLESIDAEAYTDGDRFEFRLSLHNSGSQAVIVPWEPDPQRVATGPGAPMLRTLITVRVDSTRGRMSIPIAQLFGSTMSPMNTKVLKPGAQAEIIASGHWNFVGYPPETLRAQAVSPQMSVLAEIRFLTPLNGHWYAPVESTNRIPIMVKRRPVP